MCLSVVAHAHGLPYCYASLPVQESSVAKLASSCIIWDLLMGLKDACIRMPSCGESGLWCPCAMALQSPDCGFELAVVLPSLVYTRTSQKLTLDPFLQPKP